MANFYTYGDMPDVEEAVSGISSKEMESILSQYSPEAAPSAVSDVGALEELSPAEQGISGSDEQELIAAREAQLAREAAIAERAEAEARTAREAAAARREQERIAAEQDRLAAERAAEEARQAEAARQAEEARRAEEARQEQIRQEQARKAEAARLAAEERSREDLLRQENMRQQERVRIAEEQRLEQVRQEQIRLEQVRQAEIARQAEQARQAQLARQAEAERQRQLAEMQQREEARRQAEAEAQRRAEAERIAAEQEAARVAEQQRLAREAQLAREAEIARRAEEEAVNRRQAEAARREQERIAAEQARLEQERQAEAQRQSEIQRQAEEARVAEEARQAAAEREAAQRAEAERAARQAELDRLAQAEQSRQAAEAEQARKAAQEAARVQEEAAKGPLLKVDEEPAPAPAVSSPIEAASPFVEPKTPEQAKAMQESYALLTQADAARMEPIGALNFALDFGGGGGGGLPTVIEKSLYAPEETDAEKAMREEIAKSYVAPAKAPEVSTAEVAKMSGLSEEDLTAAQKQISEPYLERNAILSEIGDRLKANDFKGAFDVALKAEQEGKGMFFENIIDPDKMRYLRGPMTADEMRKFYAELPQDEYLKRYGDRSDFISERALERNLAELGGKAGFADPRAGLKAKESVITDAIKFATEYGLDAIMAAAGIPPTFAALTKAAQTYAETGGNMEAVLKAAAATYVGTTVGQKVGDLIPSSSAVSKAAESAVEKAATQAVTAGLAGDALAEVVIQTALKNGVASTVASTLASKAIDNALRSQAEAGLEQIEVSTFKPSLEKALASTAASGATQDILSERQIEEAKEAERQAEEEKAKEDLETIKVTGSAVKPVINPLVITEKGGLEELDKPLSEQIDAEKPGFEDKKVEDQTIPEVVVKGSKPPPLDIKDVALGVGTGALTDAFTQPNVDPVTGEPKETAKTEKELDKIQENLAKASTVAAPSFLDKLKDLLGDYATPENILKLLGGLAAGTSSSGTTTKTTGTGVTGGLGGALPKYEIKRTQLSPDIDYYTYGTRPEARFFEYAQKVVEPTQPPAKEPETGMATGGLTGYAAGGSNRSRYMAGEGSGRDDKIPALLSDGEYVMDAETLALLGDGSTKEGARRMDQFRANIRKHKGRALSRGQISPNAKSPDKYMGGGLT